MSENKMTTVPWEYTPIGIRSKGQEWYITTRDEVSKSDCEAIVSAVNNTYGKGINPEAVSDLLELVKTYYYQLESTYEIGGLTDFGKDNYEKCYAAIEKSKII